VVVTHSILECLHRFLRIIDAFVAQTHAESTVGTQRFVLRRDTLVRLLILLSSLIVFAHCIELLAFLEADILVAASPAKERCYQYDEYVDILSHTTLNVKTLFLLPMTHKKVARTEVRATLQLCDMAAYWVNRTYEP
jgi:hypothetical protein